MSWYEYVTITISPGADRYGALEVKPRTTDPQQSYCSLWDHVGAQPAPGSRDESGRRFQTESVDELPVTLVPLSGNSGRSTMWFSVSAVVWCGIIEKGPVQDRPTMLDGPHPARKPLQFLDMKMGAVVVNEL